MTGESRPKDSRTVSNSLCFCPSAREPETRVGCMQGRASVMGRSPETGEHYEAFGIARVGMFGPDEILFVFRLAHRFEAIGPNGLNASVRVQAMNICLCHLNATGLMNTRKSGLRNNSRNRAITKMAPERSCKSTFVTIGWPSGWIVDGEAHWGSTNPTAATVARTEGTPFPNENSGLSLGYYVEFQAAQITNLRR